MRIPNLFPGTTFDKKLGKWKAQLRINGKLKSLGYHQTQEEAGAAVVAAKAATGEQSNDRLTIIEKAAVTHNRGKSLVYQSNQVLESWLRHPDKMSYYELRLFICMLQCLHNRDSTLNKIIVPIEDFIPSHQSIDGYLLLIKNACKSLMNRQIELNGIDGSPDSFGLRAVVISLDYVHTKRIVIGEFHPSLINHLISISNRYTSGDVKTLMQLKSVNSLRFYWLFREWSGIELYSKTRKPKTVEIDELRELTSGINTYGMYNDYKRNVMVPSFEELANFFKIIYKENTKGQTVQSIDFTITRFDKKVKSDLQIKDDILTSVVVVVPEVDKFIDWLTSNHNNLLVTYNGMIGRDSVTKTVAKKIIKYVAGNSEKEKSLFKIRVGANNATDRKGATPAAYIINAMKNIGLMLN